MGLKPLYAYTMKLVGVALVFSIGLGCCLPGSETPMDDDGEVLWQGSFPHDFNKHDKVERKNRTVAEIRHGENLYGRLDKKYVIELNLNPMKRKKFLIECGEWYL